MFEPSAVGHGGALAAVHGAAVLHGAPRGDAEADRNRVAVEFLHHVADELRA